MAPAACNGESSWLARHARAAGVPTDVAAMRLNLPELLDRAREPSIATFRDAAGCSALYDTTMLGLHTEKWR